MNENRSFTLRLEVEEIESRERAGGVCSSSTTSRLCTCLCKAPTANILCGGVAQQ
jgi:hypothetical protein